MQDALSVSAYPTQLCTPQVSFLYLILIPFIPFSHPQLLPTATHVWNNSHSASSTFLSFKCSVYLDGLKKNLKTSEVF